MKLPLIAACGLLLASFGALLLSLSGFSERSVDHLVTAPGVAQLVSTGEAGLSAASSTSPFAVYVPPASTPPPAAVSAAAPGAAPGAAPPPPPAPAPAPPKPAGGGGGGGGSWGGGGGHHRR